MIDTVLFDFDGTLMDTNEVIIDSWQTTFRALENREADRDVLLRTFGEPLEETMRNFFPNVPLEEALSIYRNYQRDNFITSIHLFPGVQELLDELMQRQVKMALVTSRLKFTTDQALDKFDLRKYFQHVITADDITKHKPDPQIINITLEQIGSTPQESVMVGDSILDIQCAHSAGVEAALVAWSMTLADPIREGFPPEKYSAHDRPDLIIEHPREILELL